jgi:DNA-binding LacI/PurR family transcriptional regulator
MADKEDRRNDAGRPRPVRTLADLARLAGVSTGTVSRALAGKSLVNPQTRDRIQALAREHGFRPNQMASKLRSRRTGVIGLVAPPSGDRPLHVSDPFATSLAGHLAEELTTNGYDIMLGRAVAGESSEWLERMTDSGMVDGVIVIGQADQFETIENVAARYLPMVVWGHYHPGQVHCVVGTDNAMAGKIAADHLIGRGARSLVFLGSACSLEVEARYRAARDAAEAAGAALKHIRVDAETESAVQQIAEALHDCGADGLLAASDFVAMAALRAFHDNGLRVPEDMQVIGFDDMPFAAQTMPRLTTIRRDVANAAKAMVERLRTRIDGGSTESFVMPPHLVERGTTLAA